jgi:hypothetical protein
MEERKPATPRLQIVFEKTDAMGSSRILLSRYDDGSVYLEGALEVIFEAETPLESPLEFLRKRGYIKRI